MIWVYRIKNNFIQLLYLLRISSERFSPALILDEIADCTGLLLTILTLPVGNTAQKSEWHWNFGTVVYPFTCIDSQCNPWNCIMPSIISETITSNAPPITTERVNFPPGTIGGTGASNSSEYLSDQDIAAGKTPKSTRTP